jgi:hypothetical protein
MTGATVTLNTDFISTEGTFADYCRDKIQYYSYAKTLELPKIHKSKGPENKRKHYQEIQKRHERKCK